MNGQAAGDAVVEQRPVGHVGGHLQPRQVNRCLLGHTFALEVEVRYDDGLRWNRVDGVESEHTAADW